jgi:protein-tyrosine-phosphatase
MAIRSVLFVCAGNICRVPSPRALPNARRVSADPGDARHRVCRHHCGDGNSATPETRRVALAAFGIDLSGHSARNVEGLDADLILTMDRTVTREVKRLKPKGRVLLLGEYAGDGEIVADPYGCDADAYRGCAEHLQRLIKAAADRIEREVNE